MGAGRDTASHLGPPVHPPPFKSNVFTMKPIIEIQNLKKAFRRTMAIDGLNLSVPEASVTAFLGPNGAGKTTTIKCLLNLPSPDSGTITLLGQDSRRLGPDEFRHIGYVSENQEMPN